MFCGRHDVFPLSYPITSAPSYKPLQIVNETLRMRYFVLRFALNGPLILMKLKARLPLVVEGGAGVEGRGL